MQALFRVALSIAMDNGTNPHFCGRKQQDFHPDHRLLGANTLEFLPRLSTEIIAIP
jgi:hypothetical protein